MLAARAPAGMRRQACSRAPDVWKPARVPYGGGGCGKRDGRAGSSARGKGGKTVSQHRNLCLSFLGFVLLLGVWRPLDRPLPHARALVPDARALVLHARPVVAHARVQSRGSAPLPQHKLHADAPLTRRKSRSLGCLPGRTPSANHTLAGMGRFDKHVRCVGPHARPRWTQQSSSLARARRLAKTDPTKYKSTKSKAGAKKGTGSYQYQILQSVGISEADIPAFSDPLHWLDFFPPLAKSDITAMGCGVDWRRSFITTDVNPFYDSFVRWQFNLLRKLGKVRGEAARHQGGRGNFGRGGGEEVIVLWAG
eukprot:364201-Chlamydomonas_euryale.AAC.4